jgi:RNA polymerase sigma factor (sigma-70 family)
MVGYCELMQPSELERFHAGDDAAFAALLASLDPALRRQIRARVGDDRDVIDDLLDETHAKIFERRLTYRGIGSIASWASRLCERLCADHSRRESRGRRLILLIEAPSDTASDSRSESDRVRIAEAYQSRFEAVTDAVAALPPRKRAIALAHWYLGWTPAHIAREFGLKSATVWTALSQIRATLRRDLAPFARVPSLTPI